MKTIITLLAVIVTITSCSTPSTQLVRAKVKKLSDGKLYYRIVPASLKAGDTSKGGMFSAGFAIVM